MSPVNRRLAIILGAAAVGALFAAGLFVNGRAGGAILLVVAAILATLTYATWAHRRQGRELRLLILLAVVVIAVIKLANG
jgi:hypothetical protein